MRNPKWHRDELILALNLYFDESLGTIDKTNPKIIELSQLLNQLPLFKEKPDPKRFRNPNGVALKLSNFKAIDPEYSGKGMQKGGKLDRLIFEEYIDKRNHLSRIAEEIKKIARSRDWTIEVNKVEDNPLDEGLSAEGKILFKLHQSRERNRSLITKKKEQTLKNKGKLECEICHMNFEELYGDLGKNFIECHHIIPLFQLTSEKKTRTADLALLCSNCHRMIHRVSPIPTIEEFKLKYYLKNKKRHDPV